MCMCVYIYMTWLDSQKTAWLTEPGQNLFIPWHVYPLQSEHTPGDG